MKILVVDDEKTIVKGIKFNLENEGYQVDVCYDGETAVDMARRGEYAVILLDLMMPKLDGLGACQQIRQFSTVPIIMLTARSEDADKLIGFESGADDYITKPFNILEVKSRIKAVLQYKKPAFWLAAAAVIAGIAASVCLLTSPKTGSRRSDSLVVRDCIVEDGCEGIGYKLVSSTYEKNNISIRVKWTNKRKEELSFGEEFKLFKTDGDAACMAD